ncbi:MAG: ATP-binding cassette domain-containing protein [Anaerolineales bacterium]|nr:ATP-binding cassette domain-containing protein [Anaerolineales bacterium]
MLKDIVLQTQGLKKYFGKVHAVDGVTISVPRGQVYGFLGPNGSGKTTTIGMILGLLHPTAGSVALFGERVTPYNTKPLRRVGALVGHPSLVPYLTARQNLEMLARLSPELPAGRVGEVIEIVGLHESADRRAGQFSTGMKQRLGLAMSLLHKPELLILDEPTNGMDPMGMHEVRNLLSDLAGRGVTIFISSHLLHEVEQICDRVGVLNKGKVIAEGRVKELLSKTTVVKVRVPSPAEAIRLLQSLPGCSEIKPNGAYVTVCGVSSQAVVSYLTSKGVVPSEVSTGQSDLESIFLELTAGDSKEG